MTINIANIVAMTPKELELATYGWLEKPVTEVISDPEDSDRLFLQVWTEQTDPITCNAHPKGAWMKIYSNEYTHLREYITKYKPSRVDLYRTNGGELCIMLPL